LMRWLLVLRLPVMIYCSPARMVTRLMRGMCAARQDHKDHKGLLVILGRKASLANRGRKGLRVSQEQTDTMVRPLLTMRQRNAQRPQQTEQRPHVRLQKL